MSVYIKYTSPFSLLRDGKSAVSRAVCEMPSTRTSLERSDRSSASAALRDVEPFIPRTSNRSASPVKS